MDLIVTILARFYTVQTLGMITDFLFYNDILTLKGEEKKKITDFLGVDMGPLAICSPTCNCPVGSYNHFQKWDVWFPLHDGS